MNTFRILFTGSRSWDKPSVIFGALDIIAAAAFESGFDRVVLVHGACPKGGDSIADVSRASRSSDFRRSTG